MMILFAQQKRDTMKSFRQFFKKYLIRAIFIKRLMRAGTALPAKLFGWNAN